MSEIEFNPHKNNILNLSELSLNSSVLSEMRICELYEIASLSAALIEKMLGDGFGIYEALSLISQGLADGEPIIHEKHIPENFETRFQQLSCCNKIGKCLLALPYHFYNAGDRT